MRKQISVILATIVVAALAFGVGVLVQRQYQIAPIRVALDFARDITGVDDAVPPAPPWDEWHYPKAKRLGYKQGMSLRLGEKLVRPAGHYTVLVTADDFEDVARFYAEKSRFDDPDAVAKSRSAMSSQGTLQGESNFVLDDSDIAGPGEPRPVRGKCLIRRCPSYDLTVFLTRADDEAYTHIVLLYDPKTETSSEKP